MVNLRDKETKNPSRIVMDSRWHSKFGSVVIGAPGLGKSRFGEGGGGLTSGFLWLFYEIPHSCLQYATGVTD